MKQRKKRSDGSQRKQDEKKGDERGNQSQIGLGDR